MITGYKTENHRLNKPSKIILAIMIIAIMIFFGIVIGCGNYDQMIELRTSGISNYDTTRTAPGIDSVEYPYWRQCIIHYDLDSERTERTYFLIKFTAYGKTDTDIVFIKKDTIKIKE